MSQLLEKPGGSIIDERQESGGLVFFWQLPNHRLVRWATASFVVFWLGAWAVGWVFGFWALLNIGGLGGMDWLGFVFILCWLGGWTVGGIYAIWMLQIYLRPTRPECVTLGFDSFQHDPGWSFNPWTAWHAYSNFMAYWKEIFKSRKPIDVSKNDLKAFILDRVGERQRLAFDFGADRIEIGNALREPEREWLFHVLEAWRTG